MVPVDCCRRRICCCCRCCWRSRRRHCSIECVVQTVLASCCMLLCWQCCYWFFCSTVVAAPAGTLSSTSLSAAAYASLSLHFDAGAAHAGDGANHRHHNGSPRVHPALARQVKSCVCQADCSDSCRDVAALSCFALPVLPASGPSELSLSPLFVFIRVWVCGGFSCCCCVSILLLLRVDYC